jgi:alanine racemase
MLMKASMFTRPVWAEISRHALVENYCRLRQAAGEAEVMAVVKANAYGHGAVECAPLLEAAGARWFGVTTVEEGVRLRGACPEARIAIMGGMWRGEGDAVVEHRLTPFVWEPWHLDELQAAGARRGAEAASIPIILEVDTGMSRQGVRVPCNESDAKPELDAMLRRLAGGSVCKLDAVLTHFLAAEEVAGKHNACQLERFASAVRHIVEGGLRPEWVSAGSSATLLAGRQGEALRAIAEQAGARWLVRTGIAMYGYPPALSGDAEAEARSHEWQQRLQPVLSWKTRVTSLRTIAAGECAGYNATFVAGRTTRLALLPLGYADGLNRLLSNRGSVLVRGERAPIAGRVSMDQTIVDVTDVAGVEIGDEVVLIGEQGGQRITAEEMAGWMGTIPYEVLCGISARVPRVWKDRDQGLG